MNNALSRVAQRQAGAESAQLPPRCPRASAKGQAGHLVGRLCDTPYSRSPAGRGRGSAMQGGAP